MSEDFALRLHLYGSKYHNLKCNGCKKDFKTGDRVWRFGAYIPSYLCVCDDCKPHLTEIIDFNPNGSKEPPQLQITWPWIQELIMRRDGYKCRVCGISFASAEEMEVHHIIPRKDGGTNNWKNLMTLCGVCHKATFKNGYAGIPQSIPALIKEGKQMILTEQTANDVFGGRLERIKSDSALKAAIPKEE